ncbi:TatD family hydrolase [Mycoplasma haemofelis str. Langford 1]|uniref:TatD family hydrolase n=1 Tax=Mycoplasma haemofelis (strain Langford 1) TaxID=941640 RepID=E8ZK32_MYCHL|nr:TatD family hydrolase [Mycoplasma haemofelis]CBY93503.1 TatD family hydrolase [Mycoplasma haemofelis str. Langford 1]
MFKFFDSHVHLNSERLKFWLKERKELYRDWIFNVVSTNLEDLEIALSQSKEHNNVYVTAGIHPLEIDGLDLESTIGFLESKIRDNPKVLAIGEIGLDFYRFSKEEVFENQKRWFLAQCELAKRLNLPVMLHLRNASEEALSLLQDINWFGVIHCYDGDLELANRFLSLPRRWMLSISPLIFREGNKTAGILGSVDLSRFLVETDAPYLSEDSERVKDIIESLSKAQGINFEECRERLLSNFRDFFKLNET